MLVDAGGYPVGVIAAPDGRLAVGEPEPEVAQRLEQDGPGGRRLMNWVWIGSNLGLIWGRIAEHWL